MRTYSYGAKPPTENAARALNQIERAHRYYNVLVEIERERRRKIREAKDLDEQAKADAYKTATDASYEAIRRERARCGTFWGTYLQIEDAAQRAARTTPIAEDPRFRHWEGEGLLAVQIQGGMSPEELTSGEDSRARIVGEGKRRQLWLRIGSEGRAPIWAVWPFAYHRDLPVGTKVKWVRVVARRVASHTKWSVQFLIDGEDGAFALQAPTKGAVAVDVGWRKIGDEMRVATWADDSGATGELRLPAGLLERWRKVEDLEGIRKQSFNQALARLVDDRRTQGDEWPEWLREATTHAFQWQASERLANLAIRGRKALESGEIAREAPAGVTIVLLEAWRKQDKHLWEWEAHQRANVLRARREIYRLFARQLAEYRKVVFEKLDLRKFAEAPESRGEEKRQQPEIAASRPRRFKAGLSELLACAADAVTRAGGEWVELVSVDTTRTCADCGHAEKFDAAKAIHHVCPKCGVVWDQDANAARNLLARAATCSTDAKGRSRAKKADPTEESPAAARRRKGLETRRARRSKTGPEACENSDDSK